MNQSTVNLTNKEMQQLYLKNTIHPLMLQRIGSNITTEHLMYAGIEVNVK